MPHCGTEYNNGNISLDRYLLEKKRHFGNVASCSTIYWRHLEPSQAPHTIFYNRSWDRCLGDRLEVPIDMLSLERHHNPTTCFKVIS